MKRASTLPAGMTLVGDVEGDDDLVVHGRIEGDVRIGGALVVEATGVVRGDVQGRTVTVRGAVAGDAWAEERVRVDDGGRVVGDVTAPRVKVVEGARLRGRVHMGEPGGEVAPAPRPRAERAAVAGEEHPTEPGGPAIVTEAEAAAEAEPEAETEPVTEAEAAAEPVAVTEAETEPAVDAEAESDAVAAETEAETHGRNAVEAESQVESAPVAQRGPRRPPPPRMPALGRRRGGYRARTA